MPAVKVYAKKMEASRKEEAAKKLLLSIQDHLQVPIAEIFFFDLDKVYGIDEKEYCLLEIEGPEKSPEIIERLGQSLCVIFAEMNEGDCHVSAIYHPNSPDHVIEAKGALRNLLKDKGM